MLADSKQQVGQGTMIGRSYELQARFLHQVIRKLDEMAVACRGDIVYTSKCRAHYCSEYRL